MTGSMASFALVVPAGVCIHVCVLRLIPGQLVLLLNSWVGSLWPPQCVDWHGDVLRNHIVIIYRS